VLEAVVDEDSPITRHVVNDQRAGQGAHYLLAALKGHTPYRSLHVRVTRVDQQRTAVGSPGKPLVGGRDVEFNSVPRSINQDEAGAVEKREPVSLRRHSEPGRGARPKDHRADRVFKLELALPPADHGQVMTTRRPVRVQDVVEQGPHRPARERNSRERPQPEGASLTRGSQENREVPFRRNA
jgi:hypothetical protein